MRVTVTPEDRRLALQAARGPRPRNQQAVPVEQWIRRWLKVRLGIPATTPAPDQLKAAARELAQVIIQELNSKK